MDPWESVRPIGRRELPVLSGEEKRRRSRVDRAGRQADLPKEKSSTEPRRAPGRVRSSVLTMGELQVMTSEIATVNHATAIDPEAKTADRKHASVAVGVMVDKLTMLNGRPDRIVGTEAEQLRPGVRELVRVILEGQGTAA